jgi:hypothetical protein
MPADNPDYYKNRGDVECFDSFVDWAGIDAGIHACMFNVHRYNYRHDLKASSQADIELNLKKLEWYSKKLAELHRRKADVVATNDVA